MKNTKFSRFLACLLAALMLSQTVGFAPSVFAADEDVTPPFLDENGSVETQDPIAPVLKESTGTAPEVLIKDNAGAKDALAKALLANYDELSPEQIAAIDWQFECLGYRAIDVAHAKPNGPTWGPIGGFKTDGGFFGDYIFAPLAEQNDGTTFKVCIGSNHDDYREIVKVSAYTTSVVLKENASITYNMDASIMKQQIFDNAIDWEKSTLPAKETLSTDNFTFEWKTLPTVAENLDKDKLDSLKKFAPIEGGKRDSKIDFLDYPMMGAGDQTVMIKFKGIEDYNANSVEGALTVNKANVTVTINEPIKIIKAGEPIDAASYVSTDPVDPALEIYIVYVGVNTNKQSTIYLQVTGEKAKFIDGISDAQIKYLKYEESETLRGKLNKGMTVGEFKAMLNELLSYADNDLTKFIVNAMLKDYGLTYDNLKDLVAALDKISGIADNLLFAIGSPAHAGQYFATAIAVNDNYNTGVSMPGSVTVLKNLTGLKLSKNPILDANNNEITVSQAKELKDGNNLCVLTKSGDTLDSTSVGSVHYWFTGVNKIYVGSKMPTEPGRYIVTASVRGGDFFALPKTFSFTIVADPAPEA